MNDKYEFTGETKELMGHTVRRIRTTVAFADVAKGEVGGWIEKEDNLSASGNAWVCGDAVVCGNAEVYGDAEVSGNAEVSCDAEVCGNARVGGDAKVCGNAGVSGDAVVCGNAMVCGDAVVCSNARVYGDAVVCGNAVVHGDAKVSSINDYMVFKNCWSSGRWFTYTRSNQMWSVGCFYGTGEELVRKAYYDGEVTGKCYEAIVKAVEVIEKATTPIQEESGGQKEEE